jgi:cyclopropane fatty-acyl-phospholipid synthase-like methyltransferase
MLEHTRNAGLPFAEACERNREPILAALLPRMPGRGIVLEIGSGTGQHVVFFAPQFSRVSWQPSDRPEHLPGLAARIRAEGGANVLHAIELDVRGVWPDRNYAAVYSANTAHIMGWPEVCDMVAGIGWRLEPGGTFFLYGPFNEGGKATAESNAEFDRHLRERDPAMGLRDVEALDALARRHRMRLSEQVAMPANNQLLVFRRDDSESAGE